jgi:hypothetical protein
MHLVWPRAFASCAIDQFGGCAFPQAVNEVQCLSWPIVPFGSGRGPSCCISFKADSLSSHSDNKSSANLAMPICSPWVVLESSSVGPRSRKATRPPAAR